MSTITQMVRKRAPRLYEWVHYREYPRVKGYETFSDTLNPYMSLIWALNRLLKENNGSLPNDPAVVASYNTALRTISKQAPVYWIGKDILQALLMTRAPSINMEDLKIPVPVGFIMLPTGMITEKTSKGKVINVNHISWSISLPGSQVSIPFGNYAAAYARPEDPTGMTWCNHNQESSMGGKAHLQGTVKEAFFSGKSVFNAYFGAPPEYLTYDQNELTFLIPELLVKIFILMSSRKDIIEPGEYIRQIKRGKRRLDLFSPNWVGRAYRLKRIHQGGTHASPRFHWRQGHMRSQHYGPGNKKLKEIWIEPTEVGLKE